jgi:hypothetical protein
MLKSENDLIVNLDKTKIDVFRQGNYKYNKPVVYWGSSIIEVVEKYIYLGVPNMDTKQTANDIIAKGTIAEKQLYNVFYKAKLNNFDSRMKLFRSLIESIILYSSQTWAISKLHRLHIFQLAFLRKMFSLPNFVPSWFIMLETNVTPIEVIFVKKVLHFWLKIRLQKNTSLVRVCYDALKNTTAVLKRNWYSDLSKLLETFDIGYILDNDEPIANTFERTVVLCQISSILQIVYDKMKQDCIIRMQNSAIMCQYKHIKTHVSTPYYLNCNLNWSIVRLILHLRTNIPRARVSGKTMEFNELIHFEQPERP